VYVMVARAINGISINGLEYLLQPDGNVMTFSSKEEAVECLKEHGVSDAEIESFEFIVEDEGGELV
jgi:hypothetical protein